METTLTAEDAESVRVEIVRYMRDRWGDGQWPEPLGSIAA
jgi:hypothetical protein